MSTPKKTCGTCRHFERDTEFYFQTSGVCLCPFPYWIERTHRGVYRDDKLASLCAAFVAKEEPAPCAKEAGSDE